MSGRRIRVFVSYAHANRDAVELLLDHLGWLENDERIELFDDRKLIAGEEWDKRLRHEIAVADIVLFVVTAKFMSSPYCTKVELKEVLRRREAEGICVIPILAETCAWTSMPLAELQALPRDDSLQLKPLNKWGNDVDVALTQIAKQVEANVLKIEKLRLPSSDLTGTSTHVGHWRLPVPPVRCYGREAQTAAVVASLLSEPPRPVLITGAPGMGKSTISRVVACQEAVVGHFGERRAFAGLEAATDADQLMRQVALALGLTSDAPSLPFIRHVADGRPLLLVLDNLETACRDDDRGSGEALAGLAALPGVRLLASFRGARPPLGPAWRLPVEADQLPEPAARRLFLDLAGDDKAADPDLPRLLADLEGMALAIELVGWQAASERTLATLWQRWKVAPSLLLRAGNADHRLTNLERSIALSLEGRGPSGGAARRLFSLMGMLPDGMAAADLLSLLPDVGLEAAATNIPSLYRTYHAA